MKIRINRLKMMKTSQICKTNLSHFLIRRITHFQYKYSLTFSLFTYIFRKKKNDYFVNKKMGTFLSKIDIF